MRQHSNFKKKFNFGDFVYFYVRENSHAMMLAVQTFCLDIVLIFYRQQKCFFKTKIYLNWLNIYKLGNPQNQTFVFRIST